MALSPTAPKTSIATHLLVKVSDKAEETKVFLPFLSSPPPPILQYQYSHHHPPRRHVTEYYTSSSTRFPSQQHRELHCRPTAGPLATRQDKTRHRSTRSCTPTSILPYLYRATAQRRHYTSAARLRAPRSDLLLLPPTAAPVISRALLAASKPSLCPSCPFEGDEAISDACLCDYKALVPLLLFIRASIPASTALLCQ